ncbi:MAG: IS1595 family transposase [Alphaproteobacteria bacterium]|nr:IS1595 family transposase [Alphaproteobacteria bacterium]
MADLTQPHFTNEDAARAYLEASRWPNGPYCPHCGEADGDKLTRVDSAKGSKTRPGVIQCNTCRKQFTVTVGTVFERSHIPLHKWLLATHLMCSSKKGISAHQLHRMLGITYKSAWFMAHRIREAMAPAKGETPIGGEGKTVEADETFIGNSDNKPPKRPGAGGYGHKRAVLSLVERGGKVRSFKLDGSPNSYEIKCIIDDQVQSTSRLVTDGAQYYKGARVAKHQSVDHNKAYVVDGDVHTNTLEGYFSLFKRGMIGTYQHCGEQHLQRYLHEFDFRLNNRIKYGVDDVERTVRALKGSAGKRLTYRRTDGTQNA